MNYKLFARSFTVNRAMKFTEDPQNIVPRSVKVPAMFMELSAVP